MPGGLAKMILLGGCALLVGLASPAVALRTRDRLESSRRRGAAVARLRPPAGAGQGAVSTVHLAMVHGAVYDAVNAIVGGHEPYVSAPAALPWYSQDAAVAAAARHVLLNGGLMAVAGFAPRASPRSRPPTKRRSPRS